MNIKERMKHYERSEITIVALHDGCTDTYYNVYSLVELCPADQLQSPAIGDARYGMLREKLNDNYTLFIRRVFFTDPLRGLNFFQSKGLRAIYKLGDKDILFDYDEMISEPNGEDGILFDCSSADRSLLKPILPEFSCSVRIYTQISKSDIFQKLLSQNELVKAGLAVKRELGISLVEHMEYWGSVFLCLPNPYTRRARLSLGLDCRYLLVSIQERNNSSVFGGTFEITDERQFGTGFCIRKQIDAARFWVEMPNEPEKLRYRIFTKEGELIAEVANYFVKSFKFQMAIASQRRVFQTNTDNKEVPMQTYEEFSIGDCSQEVYAQRLEEEGKKRSLKYLEESYTFVYFPGHKEDTNSRQKAERVIQDIIGKAKKKCIICDPYFSAEDFMRFGTSVSSLDLVLQIVTSEAFLIQPLAKRSRLTQGDKLIQIMNLVKDKMQAQCYVLKGRKHSPLHDRFIIVDDEAYLLGSSLAEFGSRATTLFKVPDPDALDRQARSWIYNRDKTEDRQYCVTLEKWAKDNGAKKLLKKSRSRLIPDVRFKPRMKKARSIFCHCKTIIGLNQIIRKRRING